MLSMHSNKENPSYTCQQREKVLDFFSNHQDFRTKETCEQRLGIDKYLVSTIREDLRRSGRLGAYSLGLNGPPQDHMRKLICKRYGIHNEATILEIGPGANPLFSKYEYDNYYSADKYGKEGDRLLIGNVSNKSATANFQASYSSLDQVKEITQLVEQFHGFDIVVGCHSFEHETQPLKGLTNVKNILKPGGRLILFVPDGWSDDINVRTDPSHTMYITPEMAKEFFEAVGGFDDLVIENFRPNFDLLVSAVKA